MQIANVLIEQRLPSSNTAARYGSVYVALSSVVSPENEKPFATDRQQNRAEGSVPFRAGVLRPLPGFVGLFGHTAAKRRRPRMDCQQLQRIKADGNYRSGHQGNLPQNRPWPAVEKRKGETLFWRPCRGEMVAMRR